ncbi:MAG: hypothetical protein M3Z66_03280, partial [Chloroflexota bacterium]|nr:hypothetical protein [Chloroflexota bacterium]
MKTPKIFALVVALAAMLGSVAISGRAFPTQAASAQVSSNRCYNIQVLIRAQASNGAAGHIAVEYRIHNLWGNT